MALAISEIGLEDNRHLILAALGRFLGASDEKRFVWLYLENPHGPARTWIAKEQDKGAVVGIASVFPRRLVVRGQVLLGHVLGDFGVDSQYRTLGPAVQLQRACLTALRGAPAYDFPSRTMLSVYRRLQITQVNSLFRLARPLSFSKPGQKPKGDGIGNRLGWMGNQLLAFGDRLLAGTHPYECSLHLGPCGEEFSQLAQQIGGGLGICLERSARYLNWRFLKHPSLRHEVATARTQGSVKAYAVFTESEGRAALIDLFGDEGAIRVLVLYLSSLLRKRGLSVVSAYCLETHPWFGLLRRLGFMKRDSDPVVAVSPNGSPWNGTVAGENWFLTQGDRES